MGGSWENEPEQRIVVPFPVEAPLSGKSLLQRQDGSSHARITLHLTTGAAGV